LHIVLKSLESIADLDYLPGKYELIVVNNGSTDGSFEKIREFLEKRSNLRKKIMIRGYKLIAILEHFNIPLSPKIHLHLLYVAELPPITSLPREC